jgi:hypothetical protein
MTNTIEESKQLPDIDQQIQYVKNLRKNIVSSLQIGLEMVIAIEQSLLAAKLFGKSAGKQSTVITSHSEFLTPTRSPEQILHASGIKITPLRIEILAAMSAKDKIFTLTEISNIVSKKIAISKTSLIETLILFRHNGLVEEIKSEKENVKKVGRPQIRYKLKTSD